MNEIKPSTIVAFNEMFDTLSKKGFTDKDLIMLVRSRTYPKITLKQVEISIKAIKRLEKDLHLDKEML